MATIACIFLLFRAQFHFNHEAEDANYESYEEYHEGHEQLREDEGRVFPLTICGTMKHVNLKKGPWNLKILSVIHSISIISGVLIDCCDGDSIFHIDQT